MISKEQASFSVLFINRAATSTLALAVVAKHISLLKRDVLLHVKVHRKFIQILAELASSAALKKRHSR